jgi:hypothetical protein
MGLVESPSVTVKSNRLRSPGYLSLLAELVIELGSEFDNEALDVIQQEAAARPERWRESVRRVASDSKSSNRLFAARILDVIGETRDVSVAACD